MFSKLLYSLVAVVVAVAGIIQFLVWMSTARGKRLTVAGLIGLGMLCFLPQIPWLGRNEVPANLKQTHGTIQGIGYRSGSYSRYGSNPSLEIHLKDHASNFIYHDSREKVQRVSGMKGDLPITITHMEFDTNVLGLEINGVVIITPESRIFEERQFADMVSAAGLGLLLAAALVARFIRVSPNGTNANKQNTPIDREKNEGKRSVIDEDDLATFQHTIPSPVSLSNTLATTKTSTAAIDYREESLIVKTRYGDEKHHKSVTPIKKWTLEWMLIQLFAAPASALCAVILVRWFWATQLPKGDLSFGGFIYVLFAIFVFIFGFAVVNVLLNLIAIRFHSLARLCVLAGVLMASVLGVWAQQRIASKQDQERADQAQAAVEGIQQAERNETKATLDQANRPEREFQEALARIPQEMEKVVQHAPPGVIPPMLEVTPDGDALRITNRADQAVLVRVARVLKTSRTWERCLWAAPRSADPQSPLEIDSRLLAGESKLFTSMESCREQFRNGPLEFVVGGNLFMSDSAFYPWDPATK